MPITEVPELSPLACITDKFQTTFKDIPKLEKKININMPPDVSYCFYSEIEMFSGTSGDIGYFLEQTGLDVTAIYDDIENGSSDDIMSGSVYKNIEYMFEQWYLNNASSYEKSMVFYKFLNGLEFQLNEFTTTLFDNLQELDFKVDKRLGIDKIKKNLMILIDNDNTREDNDWLSSFSDEDNRSLLISRVKNLLDFLNKIQYKYEFYKTNTSHTLDELMIVSAHQFIEHSYTIFGEQNANNEEYTFERLATSKKEIKHIPISKKEQKTMRRMLNKSIETVSSFLPKKDIECFIGGESFEISGTYFNYKISQKKQYKLLQNESDLNSAHIPYELDLFNKNNDYLANLCITFNGCPILDQILSVYLMISANQEADMLDKCNFYKKSDDFFEDTTIQKVLPDRFKTSNNENGIVNIDNFLHSRIQTSSFNFTAAEIKKKEKLKLEKTKFKKYVKNNIFSSIFEPGAISFIFNTEVSWDEMSDYYSISRNGSKTLPFGNGGVFSDNRLDSLIV